MLIVVVPKKFYCCNFVRNSKVYSADLNTLKYVDEYLSHFQQQTGLRKGGNVMVNLKLYVRNNQHLAIKFRIKTYGVILIGFLKNGVVPMMNAQSTFSRNI